MHPSHPESTQIPTRSEQAVDQAELDWLNNLYIPEEREPYYDPPFKYDPHATDMGAANAMRIVGNAPYSAIKTAGALVDAGADVMKVGIALTQHLVGMEPWYNIDETVPGMMVRGIAGAGEIAGNASGIEFLAGEETQNAKIARAVGEYFTEVMRNPTRQVVEDPMGTLLDLSAIGGPASRMAKVGASIRRMHPVRVASEAVKQGARGTSAFVEGASAFGAGFLTGFESPHFRQMAEAARSPITPPVLDRRTRELRPAHGRRPASIMALREQVGAQNVIDQFHASMKRVTESRRIAYQDQIRKLRMYEGETLSMEPIRNAIFYSLFEDLAGYRINFTFDKSGNRILDFSQSTIGPGESGSRNMVTKLVRELDTWEGNSIFQMDALKKRIGQFHKKGESFSTSNGIVDDAYDVIRDQLGRKVEGYNELVGPYEYMSKQLKQFDTVLSASSDNPEAVLNKLTGILKDSPTAHLRKQVMDEMVRLGGGRSIMDQVAGLSLSQKAPKGLIGRSVAVSGAPLGGYGAYAFSPEHFLGGLAFLSMTSPRVMGEFFSVLGVAQRQADNVVRFMEELNRRVPNAVEDGLTVGGAFRKAISLSEDWSHMSAEQELLDAERAKRKSERVSRETRNRPPIGGGGGVGGAGATVLGVNIR